MAKQYDVYEHIREVSSAAESCRGLVAQIGSVVVGTNADRLPRGWARGSERKRVTGLMDLFCRIDLGHAFPVDPDQLNDSMRHLAQADAAFNGGDSSARAEFERQYQGFDEGAGPFYREYAFALGGSTNAQVISATNELIDPIVRLGFERHTAGEARAIVFPELVKALAIERHTSLLGR